MCSTICLIISLLLNGSYASLALLRVMINHWLIQFNRHKEKKTWVIIIFCNCDGKFRTAITFNLGTRWLYVSQLTRLSRAVAHWEAFFPEQQPRAIEQQGAPCLSCKPGFTFTACFRVVNYFTSLHLSFLLCKMTTMMGLFKDYMI